MTRKGGPMSDEFKTPTEFCEWYGISYDWFKVLSRQGRIPGLIRVARKVQRIHIPTFLASVNKPQPRALKHSAGGRNPLSVA